MFAAFYRQELEKCAGLFTPGDWAAQAHNVVTRARGAGLPIAGKWVIPAGLVAGVAGGALLGAAGHSAGQEDVRKTLIDAGSTPEEIARADYEANTPRSGYGAGRAIASGLAGAGTGWGVSKALQLATGVNPMLARGAGLVAGLGAAYGTARHLAERDERDRLKGM